MRRILAAAALLLALCNPAAALAQALPPGGYYQDGAYYVPGDPQAAAAAQASIYWPTNREAEYYYGPYAYAPGFGPYLRLGGESSWNPNIGTTYNAYPPGDYWSDYGFPYVWVTRTPTVVRIYQTWPYGRDPYFPGYPYLPAYPSGLWR